MDYEIGYTDEGRVTTFNATYYAGGGFALEGTDMILMSLISSVDNTYNFDNFYAEVMCIFWESFCVSAHFFFLLFFSGYLHENQYSL